MERLSEKMRIGIFGGTFDPPHIGHQILAAESLEQLSLEQVLWIPTPFPPHKHQRTITDIKHRIKMIELAIENNPDFVLSRVDIDRQPPHYAVDTMSILRSRDPGNEFFYLMGLDSLNDLVNWHHPADFIQQCDGLGIMVRNFESQEPGKIDNSFSGLEEKLHTLITPRVDISASDIRLRVKENKQFRYFVPEAVFRYIKAKNLYIDPSSL